MLDPENVTELNQKIDEIKSDDDLQTILKEVYPTWIDKVYNSYSPDYIYLQKNWEKICKEIDIPVSKIVLVEDIIFDDKHTIINRLSEIMTSKFGYCVRRKNEFTSCPYCDKVIPCEELHAMMKAHNMPVPSKWMPRCKNC